MHCINNVNSQAKTARKIYVKLVCEIYNTMCYKIFGKI